MDLSVAGILALAQLTLRQPRTAARLLISTGFPVQARWIGLILTAVLSAVLAQISIGLINMGLEENVLTINPIASAVTQTMVLAISGLAMFGVGRMFGGQGRFIDALLLTVWLQFVLLMLQVVQIVLQILIPPLSVMAGYASIVIFLYLISTFTAELHGFRSAVKTFFGVLATMMAVGMVLASFFAPLLLEV